MLEITDEELRRSLREQLRRYLELRDAHGPEKAREAMLESLPEKQAARLGPAMRDDSLARGLARALPWLEAAGLVHEIVDVSGPDEDAALEVALTCTCLSAAGGLDIDAAEAEPLLCDLELEATRRAFPGLDVRALAHRAEGARVCVFRYSRAAARTPGTPGTDTSGTAGTPPGRQDALA